MEKETIEETIIPIEPISEEKRNKKNSPRPTDI